MRIKLVTLSAVCALALGINNLQAADDVYVDLSVLGNLEPGATMFVPTQPLFPTVKKSAPQPAKAKKAAKKKPAPVKKAEPKPVDVKEDAAPAVPENINIAKKVPEVSFDNNKPVAPAEKPAVAEPQTEPAANIFAAPVSPVKEEAVVPVKAVAVEMSETVDEAAKAATAVPEAVKDVVSAPEEKAPLAAPETEKTVAEPVAAAPVIPAEAATAPVQPLIPVNAEAPAAVSNQVFFVDNSYEISPENQQKISAIIAGFENPQKNKIAIYAYNFDNGENSFKKKKLSLDRATEIRSYLLNNGYKNFSIKVINVTDDQEKRNLVEIEEIK